MKPTAVLINTSRGPVVDEPALIRALTEKWISAAGLDVFEQEPIDPGNPLLKLDNVVVTPHIAGYSDVFWQNFWRHSVDDRDRHGGGPLAALLRQSRREAALVEPAAAGAR